jgi:hypothetical protein
VREIDDELSDKAAAPAEETFEEVADSQAQGL